ncbi:MAG: hypothetical protein CMM01_23855 [Rhodopirellula sp.]|nr:hypothetical protein [Rhodopirellula sp.]
MKISAYFLMCLSLCVLSFAGCGGSGETTVIQPPEVVEDDSAMDGIDDDEYNKAMEESMNQQGG